jgi:hypothetical protein
MSTIEWNEGKLPGRFRIITDNDYSGDPDGLVQLAHHLLSPTVEIRAIIASHLREGDVWDTTGDSVQAAVDAVHELANVMRYKDLPPVLKGAQKAMIDLKSPADSTGARFIVEEANRSDTNTPLFIVCGGSLTSIASAWLIDPSIGEKLTVIWIGGNEYPGHQEVPPEAMPIEYNLLEDLIAGQVVFNISNLNVWQIPRNMYRDCNVSLAELIVRMKNKSKLGEYLFEKISFPARFMVNAMGSFGEMYSLGDSPLVLLTALQTGFEPAPASNRWIDLPRPRINSEGQYEMTSQSQPIRVFTILDVRMMFEDMYAKFELNSTLQIE